MYLTEEVSEALESFRRAARNGQPLLAMESLVSVVDWIISHDEPAPGVDEVDIEPAPDIVVEGTPVKAKAASRKTKVETEETSGGEDG